jgi:hypothetical protein
MNTKRAASPSTPTALLGAPELASTDATKTPPLTTTAAYATTAASR